jgi:hypothetical protein
MPAYCPETMRDNLLSPNLPSSNALVAPKPAVQAEAARAHGTPGWLDWLQHRVESGPRRSPHRHRHGEPGVAGQRSACAVPSRQTVWRDHGRAALLRRPNFRAERQLCPTMLDVGRAQHRAGERDRLGRRLHRPVANIFHTERSAGRRPPRAGRTRSPFHPRTGKTPSRHLEG